MVAEQHIFVRRHIIQAVVLAHGCCLPLGVQAQHRLGDELRIEAVCHEVATGRGDHQPGGVDGLASIVAIIISGIYGVLFFMMDLFFFSGLSVILIGSLLAFLRFNLSNCKLLR